MSISNKIEDRRSGDPIERAILENEIRIEKIEVHHEDGFLLIVLNNENQLKMSVSDFPRLSSASEEELKNYELIGGGIGVHWPNSDEHLSLKGMVENIIRKNTLEYLTDQNGDRPVLA